jgi:hypothetical protein
MKRVVKRTIRRDDYGNVIHDHVEIIAQNGDDTNVLSVETFETCPSCLRPIKPDDPRGLCEFCGMPTCTCGVACALCSKNLCGRCRRGVLNGADKLTVCTVCKAEVERTVQEARALAAAQEKLKLIQSPLLNNLPGIDALRQLSQIALMRKLNNIERRRKP